MLFLGNKHGRKSNLQFQIMVKLKWAVQGPTQWRGGRTDSQTDRQKWEETTKGTSSSRFMLHVFIFSCAYICTGLYLYVHIHMCICTYIVLFFVLFCFDPPRGTDLGGHRRDPASTTQTVLGLPWLECPC